MPVINNWSRFGNHLFGEISDHPRQDNFKSPMQITSPITEMNEEEGWCQTLNTRYELGEKNEGYVNPREDS